MLLLLSQSAYGDLLSSLSFGSGGPLSLGTDDIVNAQTTAGNLTATSSFDIYSGTSATGVAVGTDGVNDLTLSFSILSGEDPYGGGVIDPLKGVTHDVRQVSSGIQGSIPVNASSANNSSTGDVHGYSVRVQFADHLVLEADDFQVLLNSSNTTGSRFESTAIVFEDESGVAFGAADYNGFWNGAPQGSNGGTNTTLVNSAPYTVTGNGVWLAAATTTVDVSDSELPTGGTSSVLDSSDPFAGEDGGLSSGTRVGGFTWTVRLEDVATTAVDDMITQSVSTFTARLEGVNVVIRSSAAVPEPAAGWLFVVTGVVVCGRRRWRARRQCGDA
ncbi:MAG: hypothetical protein NXI04_02095 [Planctomycetaceae bacterium]|nr:hypothetical protein [Planctomycetaceae bacterium]